MQTTLAESFRNTPDGVAAERILRSCVHCGFCLATCPTYQILGNELDSPRGRIYLMKQVLEGTPATAKTQLHLDRCLTCRNCETTCPSGVEYGKLLDIGRQIVEKQVGRSAHEKGIRAALKHALLSPILFNTALKIGQSVRGLMPGLLKSRIPAAERAGTWPAPRHPRTMLVLAGCVQPGLKPNINAATARVLDQLGISLLTADNAGCCGALAHHLNDHDDGLNAMRRNIDAWIPHLDTGAEAIVMTASGCGVMVKDYGWLLRNDPAYADKATRVSAATRDIAEILTQETVALRHLTLYNTARRIAYHPPCTLQHGQKISGVVETLLTQAGFELTPVVDQHVCCGSAGTYSILQPTLSSALKTRKLAHLQAGAPTVIVTANIGCLTHLQSGSTVPVRHWIELLDEALPPARPVHDR
ncbi:MAG TPA: glycolate oxidase subunit GlcF [Thiobacillus sp.]